MISPKPIDELKTKALPFMYKILIKHIHEKMYLLIFGLLADSPFKEPCPVSVPKVKTEKVQSEKSAIYEFEQYMKLHVKTYCHVKWYSSNKWYTQGLFVLILRKYFSIIHMDKYIEYLYIIYIFKLTQPLFQAYPFFLSLVQNKNILSLTLCQRIFLNFAVFN